MIFRPYDTTIVFSSNWLRKALGKKVDLKFNGSSFGKIGRHVFIPLKFQMYFVIS